MSSEVATFAGPFRRAADGTSEAPGRRGELKEEEGPTRGSDLRWLRMRLGQSGGRALNLAVAAGLLGGVALIVQAGLLAAILSRALVGGAELSDLALPLAALFGVILLRALARYVQDVAAARAAIQVKAAVRRELAERLADLGPLYANNHAGGALASALVDQVEALEGYVARFLPQVIIAVIVPLAILAVVAWLDWLAALLLALAAPLIPFFMVLVGYGAEAASRRQIQAQARLSGHFADRLRGLVMLRLFNHGRATLEEVAQVSEDNRRRAMEVLRIAFLSSAVLEFFSAAAIAIIAIYIGLGLLGFVAFGPAGALTLFGGLFILLLAPDYFQPLRTLAQHYHDRADGLAATAEIRRHLEAPVPGLPAARKVPRPRASFDHLILTDLAIRYPDSRRAAAAEINLELRPSEAVALIGPSGSGKSSLISVLVGFLAPSGGRIELDGQPLEDLSPEDRAAAFAWIGQRTPLLPGTIAENIRLGRPEAGEEAVLKAARSAGLAPLLAQLPQGVETPLGARGFGLSGGQAQRVALARALLKDAPVLLLDEPTASLDPAGEAELLRVLGRLRDRGKAILIAAHSRAVADWADRSLDLGVRRAA